MLRILREHRVLIAVVLAAVAAAIALAMWMAAGSELDPNAYPI